MRAEGSQRQVATQSSSVVGSGVRRHRGVATSGSRDGRGDAGSSFVFDVGPSKCDARSWEPEQDRGLA